LEARFNNLFVLAAILLNNTNTINSIIPTSIPQPFCSD
jgi:hypothetical protein